MIIREATTQDASAIAEVHVSSWRTTYVGQVPQTFLDELSVARREEMWRGVLGRATHRVFVAQRDGVLVGFSSAGPSRDADAAPGVGELYSLYLIEESKGIGLGRSLWEANRASFIMHGYTEVTLWVLDTNTRARRFYERVGFQLDGAEKCEHFGERECIELRYRLNFR